MSLSVDVIKKKYHQSNSSLPRFMEFESTLEISLSTMPRSFFGLSLALESDRSLLRIISCISLGKFLNVSEASVSSFVRWDNNISMWGCEDRPGIEHGAHTLSRWQLLSSLLGSPTQCPAFTHGEPEAWIG